MHIYVSCLVLLIVIRLYCCEMNINECVSCLHLQEDDRIIELVEKYGCKKWSVIARSLPGRIGKQCRER